MEASPGALAGLFRVLFFLSVGLVILVLVSSGIPAIYEPPGGGSTLSLPSDLFPTGISPISASLFDDANSAADYNRNLGLIYSLIGIPLMAFAVVGLAPRFNALRAGLLFGGLMSLLGGVESLTQGSDDWLAFVVPLTAAGVLMVVVPWVEGGAPGAIGGHERVEVRTTSVPGGFGAHPGAVS